MSDLINDALYSGASTGLSMILGIGPILSNIFELAIKSPGSKRTEALFQRIGYEIQALVQEQKISWADIENRESFHTSAIQAFALAPRLHQQERIDALVNAVVNTAVNIDIDDDLKYTFIEYINILTVSHLKLLKHFSQYESEINQSKSYEILFGHFIGHIELIIDRDNFKLLCDDLVSKQLIRVSDNVNDFSDVQQSSYIMAEGPDNAPMLRVTNIGRKFLKFISGLERIK